MERIAKETMGELVEVDDEVGDQPTASLSDSQLEDRYTNLSFRVIYQSNNYFLPQIKDLINGKEVLNLRPEYQRRLVWSNKQKSLLIESLLLNVPVPPIFLYESDLARYEVMDGQQRLNAIYEFLENEYALTGLEKLAFLTGRRFKALPPKLRRGLERASVSAIVLLQETKSDASDPYIVRRYVFERLNNGGRKLNPQELRNSIYRGPFNDLIVRLTRDNVFCRLFDIPEYTDTDESEYYENPDRQKNNLYRTMGDCQIVLRFFSLQDDEHIRGSMRSILDGCMKRNQGASASQIEDARTTFLQVLNACAVIFNNEAFLLPPDEKGNRRLSIALYDAIMVALYRKRERLEKFIVDRDRIQESVAALLQSNLSLMTGKANTAQSIKDRINEIGRVLDKTN